MILVLDGKHVIANERQFSAIQRKLKPQFEERRLVLVPRLEGAELIATIECVTQSGAPELMDLVVRDVSSNTFVTQRQSQGIPADMPSLREADRVHKDAMARP
jgi:hypothetical protein